MKGALENAVVAAFWAWVMCRLVVWQLWPWDWRGKRKAITLKSRDRDWS